MLQVEVGLTLLAPLCTGQGAGVVEGTGSQAVDPEVSLGDILWVEAQRQSLAVQETPA